MIPASPSPTEAAAAVTTGPPLRADAKAVVWGLLVGAAAGAIAGFVVGGVGGRLAMLLLRLTSPDSVIGVTSDDGFEIGRITADTLELFVITTFFGAVSGLLYAVFRGAIPARLRLPLWTAFAALVGGANFVHEDGVDFALLEPALLAIALFIALPGIAAAVVVVLVERWTASREPWGDRRLTALVVVASLAAGHLLAVAALVALAAVVGRRVARRSPRRAAALRRVSRVLVPAGLAAVGVWNGIDLVLESGRILG